MKNVNYRTNLLSRILMKFYNDNWVQESHTYSKFWHVWAIHASTIIWNKINARKLILFHLHLSSLLLLFFHLFFYLRFDFLLRLILFGMPFSILLHNHFCCWFFDLKHLSCRHDLHSFLDHLNQLTLSLRSLLSLPLQIFFDTSLVVAL